MLQVGLLIFLTRSIIFSIEAKQNYRFLATGLPVKVKHKVTSSNGVNIVKNEVTQLAKTF